MKVREIANRYDVSIHFQLKKFYEFVTILLIKSVSLPEIVKKNL